MILVLEKFQITPHRMPNACKIRKKKEKVRMTALRDGTTFKTGTEIERYSTKEEGPRTLERLIGKRQKSECK